MIEQMEFGNFGFGFFAFSSPDDITYPDGQSYPGLPSVCVCFTGGRPLLILSKDAFLPFILFHCLGRFYFR